MPTHGDPSHGRTRRIGLTVWVWLVLGLSVLANDLPAHRFPNSLTGSELTYRYLLPTNLPPGTPDRHPVLFWLPDRDDPPGAPGLDPALVLAAIQNGILPPLIVVYPGQGAASWFQDSADGRIGDETFFLRDLLPHVDRHLPTRPEQDRRFLMGRGSGGFAALRLALRHPRRFAAASALEATLPTPSEIATDPRFQDLFQSVYRADPARATTNHPAAWPRFLGASDRAETGFQLVSSRAPGAAEPRGTRQVIEAFRSARVPLDLVSRAAPGDAALAGLEFLVSWSAAARALDRDGPWVNPPTNRPPRLSHHLVYSPTLRRPVGYCLWLPPEVSPAPPAPASTATLPVLYHLGGRGETEASFLETTAYLSAALRLGEFPRAAWVWLYAGRSSWYTDAADGRVPSEQVLLTEVIPGLEARWNLGGTRERRTLDGWGMGAFGALALAARHPGFARAVLLHNPDLPDATSFPLRHPDAWIATFHSDPAFHDRVSPWTRLGPATAPADNRVRIRLAVGARAPLLSDARRLRDHLQSLGWPHEYEEVPNRGAVGPALFPVTALRDLRFLRLPHPEPAPGRAHFGK